MRFFIDTASLDEIKTAYGWGIVDGVTADRSLVAVEGCDLRCFLGEICRMVDGPVSVDVASTEFAEMIEEAHEMASWHPNAIIRVPMTQEGIRAVRHLSDEGIRTNVTLVFSTAQALVAAKAGATYVSVPVSGFDESDHDGMEVVRDTVAMTDAYGSGSEVMASSIREVGHVVDAMRAGAHVAAMPFKVMEQLFHHPLTDICIGRSRENLRRSQQRG